MSDPPQPPPLLIPAPPPAARRERLRWGRFVSLTGLLMLCVSFFLPHIRTCGSPDVPVDMTVDSDGTFLVTVGLPFLAAIVLLPLYTFHAARWLLRTPRARKTVAVAICVICLVLLVPGSLLMMIPVASWVTSTPPDPDGWVWLGCTAVVVGATLLAFAGLLSRSIDRKAAAGVFGVGVASLAFFSFWLWGGNAMYGLWLSCAACFLIALGAAIDWFPSRPP